MDPTALPPGALMVSRSVAAHLKVPVEDHREVAFDVIDEIEEVLLREAVP